MSISDAILVAYKENIKEIIAESLKYSAYSYYKKSGRKYSPDVITEIDSNIKRMIKALAKEMIADDPAVKKLYLTAMRNCDLIASSSESDSGASDEDESG
jgi:hypothetical protein